MGKYGNLIFGYSDVLRVWQAVIVRLYLVEQRPMPLFCDQEDSLMMAI